jgi:single-strand selective monofunctional uracil DNA glycosylase
MTPATRQLIEASRDLCRAVDRLAFKAPITHVYNPLRYARASHEAYLERFGRGRKRVLFLGMNPGPFGMAQTGVPFGEIAAVRDWMGIDEPVGKPEPEHPKRLVQGLKCPRSEVSGRRLWGLFEARFGEPDQFFKDHFVVNYCPLALMEASGRNFTPDKLPAREKAALMEGCDAHLRAVVAVLRPEWLVGVGDFAVKRLREVLGTQGCPIGKILHPSPASPAANRDWAGLATRQLVALGVWAE